MTGIWQVWGLPLRRCYKLVDRVRDANWLLRSSASIDLERGSKLRMAAILVTLKLVRSPNENPKL